MYELWNINCKTERDVWVVKYRLQAWAWCMSCEIWNVRLSVMYELWNINCKSERDVWVACSLYFATHTSRSGLQFIFHNSYITLRLAVYISQQIHHAQACSLYFTTHTLRSDLQFIFHNSYITLRLTVHISQLIHHAQAVWVVKYKL
jgi:hypothetical protein